MTFVTAVIYLQVVWPLSQLSPINKLLNLCHSCYGFASCLTSVTAVTDSQSAWPLSQLSLIHKMFDLCYSCHLFTSCFFLLQLSELASLRTDLKQLMGIARQLEPYIRSITTVMERIQPEVRCQIHTRRHDTQQNDVQLSDTLSTIGRYRVSLQLVLLC